MVSCSTCGLQYAPFGHNSRSSATNNVQQLYINESLTSVTSLKLVQ